MKYNIVANEGVITSVTVFIGSESFVASQDHPNFAKIVDEVRKTEPTTAEAGLARDKALRDLFDLSLAVGAKFDRLSERVLVRAGRVHFDGVEVHNSLTETIAKFYQAGLEDFQPLVNFMEKIETNPSPHSREHLFRWLTKHNFSLCPDGDFLAYKAVLGNSKSSSRGEAIVNNEWVRGQVLNVPGTIVEMPRDKVTFDPHNGCSTGLHAGNWRYASTFLSGQSSKLLRVKINPRDVVSVPVDSQDQKLRVCRYRVLDVVRAEDRSMLYLGDLDKRTQRVEPKKAEKRVQEPSSAPQAPAQAEKGSGRAKAPKKAQKAAEPPVKLPRYYEEFTAVHFNTLAFNDLRWLAKEWGITNLGSNPAKAALINALLGEGAERRKTWKKG
jgi:hypothetical protein